jgi:hypothetical protein
MLDKHIYLSNVIMHIPKIFSNLPFQSMRTSHIKFAKLVVGIKYNLFFFIISLNLLKNGVGYPQFMENWYILDLVNDYGD